MKNTDMTTIKQITKKFVETEVLEFNKCKFKGIPLNTLEEMYKKMNQPSPWDSDWVSEVESVKRIFMSVDSSLIVKLFMKIKDYMSLQDYSESLMDAYTMGLTGQLTVAEWCGLFRKADKKFMMSQDDYDVYRNLSNNVSIYRGSAVDSHSECDVQDAANCLSWTLDIERADWFANREFNDFNKAYAVLMKADIPKDRVIAYDNGRSEQEIIVDVSDYDMPYEIVKEYE